MSSAAAAGIVLVCVLISRPDSIEAAGWEGFVRTSDRSEDSAIIELLSTSDFATQRVIITALGEREDPYLGDVLEALAGGTNIKPDFRREYLLRLLIGTILDPSLPPQTRKWRTEVNRESLEMVARRVNDFEDPQLKAEIIRLLPDFDGSDLSPVLSETCAALAHRLEKQQGELSPMDTDLLLALLGYLETHPEPDLLEQCLTVARLSRDRQAVDAARAGANAIVEAMR
jgi:hypothetical protein